MIEYRETWIKPLKNECRPFFNFTRIKIEESKKEGAAIATQDITYIAKIWADLSPEEKKKYELAPKDKNTRAALDDHKVPTKEGK